VVLHQVDKYAHPNRINYFFYSLQILKFSYVFVKNNSILVSCKYEGTHVLSNQPCNLINKMKLRRVNLSMKEQEINIHRYDLDGCRHPINYIFQSTSKISNLTLTCMNILLLNMYPLGSRTVP
jgi:hypothetical protein